MNKIDVKQVSITRFTMMLLVVWTLLIVALAIRQISYNHEMTKDTMINEARSLFNRDQAFRLWGASHGGVYVPVSERAVPNPYLTFIDNRDVETLDGRTLTLINPAYMVRLMNENFSKLYGIVGHITSLKPLNPGNAADPWEQKSLLTFEEGANEKYDFTDYNDEMFLRLMRPLPVEQTCLKCHEHQGYKVGDVRGGISISIPMKQYLLREHAQSKEQVISFGIIWLLGIIGLVIGSRGLRRSTAERDKAYEELKRYHSQLEMLVKDRTKELEEANESLNEKVEEVEQANDELKNFTHIVSHDLKNPITSIMGMSELLKEDYDDKLDATGKHLIERIKANSIMMNKLIKGLLVLARIGGVEDEEESVNMNALIRQIIEENQDTIEKEGVQVHLADNLPEVVFMRIRLYQLFSNLIRNALKFMRKDVTPEIKIGYEETADEHIVSVNDNGIGISQANQQKIFDMFSRIKDKDVEGTGIGLAIVRKIIKEENGRVWVESEKGVGSTFYVALKKVK